MPNEVPALLWSFGYFFCLLCGYYILRPLRDEMGVAAGVENLQWLFTGTFLAMLAAVPLFGWAVARLPRAKLLPAVYVFFIVNILVFYALFTIGFAEIALARAFFIWTSVFNLFVVSVFWSFMADLFDNRQARRLFGFIAAGGSAGAIVGPSLTAALAIPIGPVNLLLLSALLLAAAVLCIFRLSGWSEKRECVHRENDAGEHQSEHTAPSSVVEPIGGGILNGIKLVFSSRYLLGICVFILLFTTLSTFLYFLQAQLVADNFEDPAERTTVFALIDVAVNILTISVQVFVTGRLMSRFGVTVALTAIPVLIALGFIGLAVAPILAVLLVFQVVRRAGGYSIMTPAREVLFTVVDKERKYKAKNFIDTVVNRGGDAVSAWLFAGLKAGGLGLGAIAVVAVPIAVLWIGVAVLLGRKQERLKENGYGKTREATVIPVQTGIQS